MATTRVPSLKKPLDRITAPSKPAAETPGRALNRLSRAQSPRRSERPSTADRVSTEPDTEEPSAVTKGLMASFGAKETEEAKETEKGEWTEEKLEDGSTVRTQSVVTDGVTTETQEVIRPDGTIERTTSETQAAEESFEELTGAEPQGLPEEGRESAQVTNTQTVLIDPSTEPPTETLVSDGQTVSQSAPIEDADLPDGVTLDQDQSQLTRSQATVTTYGPDGEAVTETSDGVTVDVVGQRADGSEVSVSNSTLTGPDGTQVLTQEHRGFTYGELDGTPNWSASVGEETISLVPEQGASSGKTATNHLDACAEGQFKDWLGADPGTPVDVRTTTTISPDGETVEQMEVGDLEGDGRKVSRIQDSEGVSWVQQETTEDGARIATQATREGQPDFRMETLTEHGEGQDVKVTSETWNGDVLVHETTSDHHRLTSEEELAEYIEQQSAGMKPSAEEQAAYDALQEQMQAGEEVYVTTSSDQRFDHDESADGIGSWESNSTSLSAPESGVTVARTGEIMQANGEFLPSGWGDHADGTIYKETTLVTNPGGDPPAQGYVRYGLDGAGSSEQIRVKRSDEGCKEYGFEIGADGTVESTYYGGNAKDDPLAEYYQRIDGKMHPELETESATDLLTGGLVPITVGTGSAVDYVASSAELMEKEFSKIPGIVTGSLGVMMGTAQFYHGLSEGDALKASGGAALTGASAMGLGSGLTGSLGLLAKSMGAAGAGGSMAAGLMYFAEGNTTKGFLDFGTGAAVLAAAATTGPWSAGFVAAAAALTLGSLAYDLAHGDDPASADGARPINGQELFVM